MTRHPGSRWWRCDLHTHSPASTDFKGTASPEDWVDAALTAKLEVVAVTDHNGAGWIERLQSVAKDRGLILFPGFEITVLGGSHVLAVFDEFTGVDALCATLGRCGLPPDKLGNPACYAEASPIAVAQVITEHGGICIAAHADGTAGLLHTYVREGTDGKQHGGNTLIDILRCPDLLALEWKNEHPELLPFADNSKDGYKRESGPLPLLEGSDAHSLAEIGQRHTFVKMSRPNIEGLRLALLDGAMSVRRGTVVVGDPNAVPDHQVSQISPETSEEMM